MVAARKRSADVDDPSADLDGDEEIEVGDLADDLEETSLDEAFADEDDELEDDELEGADETLDDEDPTELTADPVDPAEGDEEGAAQSDVPAPPEASFDDESDDEGLVAAVTGEDDEPEVEGLKDGEFVCRSCFMAKRDTQLADPEQLLCRDCA